MKLYKISATTGDGAETLVQWVGSQTDASKLRADLVGKGFKRKDVVTEPWDIPTNKPGLLDFLNKMEEP